MVCYGNSKRFSFSIFCLFFFPVQWFVMPYMYDIIRIATKHCKISIETEDNAENKMVEIWFGIRKKNGRTSVEKEKSSL